MFEIDPLLEPVSAAEPCGPDLGYDLEFLALERLAAGVPERRMGVSRVPAMEPDWTAVAARSAALLRRTKDWRIALVLTHAALHLWGWRGLERGLALLLAIEGRFGADVHPRDDDDIGMSESRWELLGGDLLTMLREHRVGAPSSAMALRALLATPADARSYPYAGRASVEAALSAELERTADLAERLGACLTLLRDFRQTLECRMYRLQSLASAERLLQEFISALGWVQEFAAPVEPEAPIELRVDDGAAALQWRPRPAAPSVGDLADVEILAAPLAGPEPCGPNLEYDADFMTLERAEAGRPATTFGPDVPPDWLEVQRIAADLLMRTKDLRVAISLTRAMTRTAGLRGAASGLGLIAGWLDRAWRDVHPQPDADDQDDLTWRLNVLARLSSPEGLLGDLCAIEVGDAEVATLGAICQAGPGEMRRAVALQLRQEPDWLDHWASVCVAVDSICGSLARYANTIEPVAPLVAFVARLQPAATGAHGGEGDAAIPGGEAHAAARQSPPMPTIADWTRWRSAEVSDYPSIVDVAALAEPIAGDDACGPDLEYDHESLQLAELEAGYGRATPPEWWGVLRSATDLLSRTKDLRIAITLTRAAARIGGLHGAAQGLCLIARLLERYWPLVHPRLDPDDGDPIWRLNALARLASPDGLLGDLHAVVIGHKFVAVALGDLQGVRNTSSPQSTAASLAPLEMRAVIETQLAVEPHWLGDLQAARSAVDAVRRSIARHLRNIDGLAPLAEFLARLQGVAQAALAPDAPAADSTRADPDAPSDGSEGPGPDEDPLEWNGASGAENLEAVRQTLRRLVDLLAQPTAPASDA